MQLQPDTLIHNPDGCRVVSSVEIPAAATSVWNIVGNFAGFPVFIPCLGTYRYDRQWCAIRTQEAVQGR